MRNTSSMDGSSFQKQLCTSRKMPRVRRARAWACVGALESGFKVEPCPTKTSAQSETEVVTREVLGKPSPPRNEFARKCAPPCSGENSCRRRLLLPERLPLEWKTGEPHLRRANGRSSPYPAPPRVCRQRGSRHSGS